VFKREKDAYDEVSLREERKALVERYMIDAEEAEARTRRDSEQPPDPRARREAEAIVPDDSASTDAPEVVPETVAATAPAPVVGSLPEPAADGRRALPGPGKATEALPVYSWFERVVPTPPDASDWPRELVKAQQARSRAAAAPEPFV
jgi:hypothetical protein